MQIEHYTTLRDDQKHQIRSIWNKVYPQGIGLDTPEDMNNYLAPLLLPNHLILEDEQGKIYAWYYDFYRNDERWFALIVDNHVQNQGWGKSLLNTAKSMNSELNGWVVITEGLINGNGTTYNPPLSFYLKNGFKTLDNDLFKSEIMTTIHIHWKK